MSYAMSYDHPRVDSASFPTYLTLQSSGKLCYLYCLLTVCFRAPYAIVLNYLLTTREIHFTTTAATAALYVRFSSAG